MSRFPFGDFQVDVFKLRPARGPNETRIWCRLAGARSDTADSRRHDPPFSESENWNLETDHDVANFVGGLFVI